MSGETVRDNYLKSWVGNKSDELRRQENARAFDTFKRFFEEILNRKFEGAITDLGCGDGSFYRYCEEQGMSAQGFDLSDGLNFEQDQLPIESDSQDIIMLYSVIEHIWDPSVLLQEIFRGLKSGGVVYFIVPNIDYCGSSFYDDHTHIRPYNSTGIKRLMNSFGYKTLFSGLWTVGKPTRIWRRSEKWQFRYGKWLPFSGRNKWAPKFLKGKSVTMLCAFVKP